MTVLNLALLNAALAVAWKDLRAELRNRQTVAAMLLFALLSVLIFSFALELERNAREAGAAGIMWVTIIFSGMLGLGRSINREVEQGNLDGLLLAPVDRSAIYFGKLISNFILMAVVGFVLLIPLTILFNVSPFALRAFPMLSLVMILGVLGYAGVGTLIASMAVYAKGRDVLLPVLLLPIALSVIVPAVRATRDLLGGDSFAQISNFFSLLVILNIVYITLAYLLFDFVIEE